MADKDTPSRISAQVRAREAEVEAFVLRLQKIFDRSLDNVIGRLQEGEGDAVAVAGVLNDLEQAAKDAGLDGEYGKLRGIYAEELKFIKSEYKRIDAPIRFGGIDKDIVEQLVKFDTDKIGKIFDSKMSDLKSQVIRSVIVGESPTLKDLKNEFGESLAYVARTELNTAVSTFSRTVTMTKAKELGFDLFQYMGPEPDGVIRDFCRDLLTDPDHPGAIYTIQEIEAMDNEQGLSVITSGGGFNCRHEWRPIDLETAKQLGYKGDV